MTDDVHTQSIARGVLESITDQKIVLSVPGTSYQIHAVPTVAADQIRTPVGKKIKGILHAQALRMHEAKAGGRFIEPVWGEPRIVAGFVLAVDEQNRRVLADVAVPMWITLLPDQPSNQFQVGDMVNCYVRSGTQFEPTQ